MDNRTVLKAREGYILTNGEIYGRQIHLAEGIDASSFHEITDVEYERIMQEKELENKAEVI